ncbi:hypothetical protein Poli38472_002855 [Pythium oligandrum]|uniref:BCCIP family protein n=1 Tax=Pythium oligandrum TaxID=41045 RepID=A0A8K1C5W5_PYTOL|nr:hypothetical protein Poli38472_002855 [Pythium oligandrum]|eukprot:TMW56930.1 hypothetical protein Poli38472_002855 [Pythium oligandrum]
MPPQKRGRQDKAAATPAEERDDAEMAEHEMDAGSSSDSDDSDDDELTFAENMDDDDDDDEDEDDEDGDDAMDGGEADAKQGQDRHVNVEFVFSDPREAHFHSVKQFLLSYLPSSQPFDVSGLANLIVSQVTTGTMVCVEGEEDVYGFITALGLQRYQNETSIQQVVNYATKRCPADLAGRFKQILQTKNVGLVVNERMVNLPYQLVPPVHSALHEDIEWAISNEATPELRKSFEFDYFLLISSCTMEKAGSTGGKGKGKKVKTDYSQTAKFFANFEDEFLEQDAEVTFTFETPRGEREQDQPNKHTVVMLIERSRHKAALGTIAAMINM